MEERQLSDWNLLVWTGLGILLLLVPSLALCLKCFVRVHNLDLFDLPAVMLAEAVELSSASKRLQRRHPLA